MPPYLLVTFDQATAVARRDLPFITPIHPLARLAIAAFHPPEAPLITHVQIHDADSPAGTYLFACELWETIASRPEFRLTSFVWNVESNLSAPNIASVLLPFLARSMPHAATAPLPAELLDKALAGLDEQSHRTRTAMLTDLQSRNDTLIDQKLASLDAYHFARLNRIDIEITTNRDPRIQLMKTSERARAQADYESKRQEIQRRRKADIITQRVAAGIIEVSS